MKKLKSSGDYIDFIAENCDVDRLWLIGLSNQAKKEVFDDIEDWLNRDDWRAWEDATEYDKIKKCHLSIITAKAKSSKPSLNSQKNQSAISQSKKRVKKITKDFKKTFERGKERLMRINKLLYAK